MALPPKLHRAVYARVMSTGDDDADYRETPPDGETPAAVTGSIHVTAKGSGYWL